MGRRISFYTGTELVIQQNATQPVEAPDVGPEVLLTGTSNAALQSDSEEDLQSEPGSPVNDNFVTAPQQRRFR